MTPKKITVELDVDARAEKVWTFWTAPIHVLNWNFASDDWECPRAENDLQVDGTFRYRMAAKNKSAAFNFEGTYFEIKKFKLIAYSMSDGREVRVEFSSNPDGKTHIRETFDMENTNSEEMQRGGWQSILNNFKNYVEKSS